MRRPYVEPGFRSPRPAMRHRSRSNGPDRSGRKDGAPAAKGTNRPKPARLASTDGSSEEESEEDDDDQEEENGQDQGDDDFHSGEQGTERGMDSDVESVLSDTTQAPSDNEHVPARRPNNHGTLTGFSRSTRPAPEDSDWVKRRSALGGGGGQTGDDNARKGRLFGGLKGMMSWRKRGARPRLEDFDDEPTTSATILGNTQGAVSDIKDRQSRGRGAGREFERVAGHKQPAASNAMRQDAAQAIGIATPARYKSYGRTGGAGLAAGAASGAVADEEETDEEGEVDERDALSDQDAASSDEAGEAYATDAARSGRSGRSDATSMPAVILRDTANRSTPRLVNPSGHPRVSSQAAPLESAQVSVLEGSMRSGSHLERAGSIGTSILPPSSPLLPTSGPLAAVNDRPQLQCVDSALDPELEYNTPGEERDAAFPPSLEPISGVGALGPIHDGHEHEGNAAPAISTAAASPLQAAASDPAGTAKVKKGKKKSKSKNAAAAGAAGAAAVAVPAAAVLAASDEREVAAPEVVDPEEDVEVQAQDVPTQDSTAAAPISPVSGGEVQDAADGEKSTKREKSKKSSRTAAAAIPAIVGAGVGAVLEGAVGAGVGGIAAGAAGLTAGLTAAEAETTEAATTPAAQSSADATESIPKRKKSKKAKKAKKSANDDAEEAVPIVVPDGQGGETIVLANLPASEGASVPAAAAAAPAEAVEEVPKRKKTKSKKRDAALVAAAGAAEAAATGLALDEADAPADGEEEDQPPAAPVAVAATVPTAQEHPNEKANPALLGVAAAPATLTKKKSKKSKTRPVEKMPQLQEDTTRDTFLLTPSAAPSEVDLDDAAYARAPPGFDRAAGATRGPSIFDGLSPEQTHYFVRELVSRELKWELDRAWLLTSLEKPQSTSRSLARARAEDRVELDSRMNDFDDSSDEDLLGGLSDSDDEAVFRRGTEIAGAEETVPDLPILRFLIKNAFCTFPLFVAPEERDPRALPPPDKATIARSLFFSAILPLLRGMQVRSLSAHVDRHGEGDGTPFNSRSTTGAIRDTLFKWAVRYVTAVLRVGPEDPYFGGGEQDGEVGKEGWAWPAPNLLPPEAYRAYRRPVDKLKYGGYEVDIVGIRVPRPGEKHYLIRVRFPNRLDEYVVRNDADFQRLHTSISRELGPFAHVRPLPRTNGDRQEFADSEMRSDSFRGESTRSSNLAGLGAGRQAYLPAGSKSRPLPDQFEPGLLGRVKRYNSLKRESSPALANSPVPARSRTLSAMPDARAKTGSPISDEYEPGYRTVAAGSQRRKGLAGLFSRGTPAPDYGDERYGDEAPLDEPFDEEDGYLARGPRRYGPVGKGGKPSGAQRLHDAAAETLSPVSTRSYFEEQETLGADEGYYIDERRETPGKKSRFPFLKGGSGGEKARPQSMPPMNNKGISRGPLGAYDSRVSFRGGKDDFVAGRARVPAGPPLEGDMRRRQLRAWLRDTLAVRGAGHSSEATAFFSIGSFSERELRQTDRMDMRERKKVDDERNLDREDDAQDAGDEVLDLRDIRDELWEECVDGDGFLKAYDSLKASPDLDQLPAPYQRLISWGNLQAARFLYGIFVAGDESRANLARAQDVYESIPWKKLSFAMRQPRGLLLRHIQEQLLRKTFIQGVLNVILEDDPESIQEDLAQLDRSIGSEAMIRKIKLFVESADDLKRLIRQHAERADIPLVSAIVRGSDHPRLNKADIARIINATRAYQDFMKTQPSPIKKANNKDPDVQLILDLQRVLRLCSLRRDGVQIRQMLTEPTIDDALADFFEPLLESLRRMHRANGTASAVLDLQRFLRRMLDVLASLRARVQDPAHSIRTIAALLEDGAHGWYAYLHTLAQVDPAVFSFFAWFRHLAMTVGAGSRDLGELFTAPPTTAGDGDEEDDAPTQDGPSQQGPLDPRTRRDINSVAEAARRKRNRQMEIACRSAAGDTEADDPIQVLGDGAGKSRTDPFFPREPRPARKTPNLDRFKRNFRHALSQALAR